MEKEAEDRTRDLIMELMRKEHAKKSSETNSVKKDDKIREQEERIKQLEKIILKS
ncbi:MAG: hypothetical protein KC444_05775 [Nitrosopumilus sp.]|nr:hypothetical protein [Nitrosopumilus sp.]